MLLIDSKDGLIGDFLGQIPTMQKLAEKKMIEVKVHPEARDLFSLIETGNLMGTHNVNWFVAPEYDKTITLSSSEAFQLSVKNNWYMSQAFMAQAGLKVSEIAPKAKLNYDGEFFHPQPVDFLISPFARSLPVEQKWQREKWQELVNKLPEKKFGVLGNYKYDDPMYINGNNVTVFFSLQFKHLCSLLKRTGTLISVVTGTSHLAFHLGVKNILLTNQNMAWGNQPDAIKITDNIHDVTVQQVIDKL